MKQASWMRFADRGLGIQAGIHCPNDLPEPATLFHMPHASHAKIRAGYSWPCVVGSLSDSVASWISAWGGGEAVPVLKDWTMISTLT
jgi:hypothetical protein